METFRELVLKNRSYRRFHQEKVIGMETLRELVDLARLTPSAANRQPLRYFLSYSPDRNAAIFPHLRWAGYLTDWPGPAEGERPTAYIIILGDKSVSEHFGCDHGVAAQTILLGAAEKGLGGCMVGSLGRAELMDLVGISPERYEILLVVALGAPKETVVIERVPTSGDIRYWRAPDGVHHVPKRALDDIIIT